MGIAWAVLQNFILAVDFISCAVIYYTFLTPKKTKRYICIFFLIGILISLFRITVFTFSCQKIEYLSHMLSFTYILIGFKDSIKRKMAAFGGAFLIIGFFYMVVYFVIDAIAPDKEVQDLNIIDSSKKYLALVLICLMVILMKNFKEFILDKKNPYRVSVLLIIGTAIAFLIGLTFIYSKTQYGMEAFELLMTIFYISVLLIIGAIMFLYSKIYQHLQNEHHLERERERLKLENDFNEKLNISKEELRILRHDFNGQLRTIEGMLQQGMYDRAVVFLHTIYEPVAKANRIVITQHPIMDIILSNKKQECDAQGIHLSIQTSIQDAWLEDSEISIIFNNVLNNAIEAVQKLEKSQERYIDFKVQSQKRYFELSCCNPFKDAPIIRDGRMLTTKDDKEFHGKGLRSIRNVLGKYRASGFEQEILDQTLNLIITICPNE